MVRFFKKKESDAPPDVGQEDETFYKEDMSNDLDSPAGEEIEKPAPRKKKAGKKPSVLDPFPQQIQQAPSQPPSESMSNLELEKMNARLELINSMIKSFNERFALVNQQIGEIRTMSVANEKSLSISNLDAKKVIEIVKEVNPEKLRLDYRRAEFKVNTLAEKLESNKQFADAIMEELKELKRKANLFEGTDALLKLNEDIKKDLIEIQKVNSRVRMNADKSEQIFIELNKGFQENQKINQMIANLDTSYSGIKKEIEKISISNKEVLNINDFNNFKRTMDTKFVILDNVLLTIEHLKNENDRFSKMIERILFMEKRNEEDIANLGLSTGNKDVKKIEEYEQKLFSFLELMDKMALEINSIKKRIGLRTETVKIPSSSGSMGEGFSNSSRLPANLAPPKINVPEEPMAEMAENIPEPIKEKSDINEDMKEESKNDINDLLSEGENFLAIGDVAGAVKVYEDLSNAYNPANDEDNLIYPKIIKFYNDLSGSISMSTPENSGKEIIPDKDRQYKKLNDY